MNVVIHSACVRCHSVPFVLSLTILGRMAFLGGMVTMDTEVCMDPEVAGSLPSPRLTSLSSYPT